MDNFKATVFKGLRWNLVGQVGGQIIGLLISLALARLISPVYFGKIAMINVVVGFSSIFINLGFGAAVIQNREVGNKLLSSIFWLSLSIGCVLSVSLYNSAGLLESFYQENNLEFIAHCLSPIFILSAIGLVPRTLLTKAIDFKYISLINIASISLAGFAAIFLAAKGYPLEALIVNLIGQSIILNFSIFFACKWKPNLFFSFEEIKKIWNFSMNIIGNDALNYWVRNIDTMLIGKYIGSHGLGIYNKSYALLTIPLKNISGSIGQVLFPSLATIKEDKKRVKEVYLKVIGAIGLIVFPAMIGVFVTADKLVEVVLGDSWVEAVPLIRIFCFLAMVQSISSLVNNLYLSQGRADLMFRIGTLLRVMVIISIVIGLTWGTQGVAICYTIGGFLSALINNYYGGKLINLSLFHFGIALISPFFIACFMGGLIFCVDQFFFQEISVYMRLFLQVALGGTIFLFLNEIFKPKSYLYLKDTLLSKR